MGLARPEKSAGGFLHSNRTAKPIDAPLITEPPYRWVEQVFLVLSSGAFRLLHSTHGRLRWFNLTPHWLKRINGHPIIGSCWMKKAIVAALAGLYSAVGIFNLFMLGNTPLIATEPPWMLFALWPLYWMR